MRPYTYASLLILALISCNKKHHSTTEQLIGTWELRSVSSMMPTTPLPEGNGHLMVFTERGFKRYEPGQSTPSSGTYQTVSDGSVRSDVCLEFPAGTYTQ